MTADDVEGYEQHYARQLWLMLPATYREEDAAGRLDGRGPLRELTERIGAQAAVIRRSIDRLWADQSVETCADWLVPYLGDLLATRLVAGARPREQRLDVARTVHYRRRKGTVGLIEELATDVTGWNVRVVEMFRRLERSRHLLDPPIGPAAGDLSVAQQLHGRHTGTPAGGTADLRNAYGAGRAHGPFDEYAHTADLRAGRSRTGWYAIPRLALFLYRLRSLGTAPTTPVAVKDCAGHFTFDPSGRTVPLFTPADPAAADRSPGDPRPEHLLGGPLDTALMRETLRREPAADLGFAVRPQPAGAPLGAAALRVYPELGRFRVAPGPVAPPLTVTYHYGSPGELGAGPYDRRPLRGVLPSAPEPAVPVVGGGSALTGALATTDGTVTVADSLTYRPAAPVTAGVGRLRVLAGARQRPLIRLPAGDAWTLTGTPGAVLELDGLWICGGDLVLRGHFDTVLITCCTLDPGTVGAAGVGFAVAADGRDLTPTRLWVEAVVRRLELRGTVTGPVRVRAGGSVQECVVTDSAVQAVDPGDPALETSAGEVRLLRSTVLGRAPVHRLSADESILHGLVTVQDVQHGCVRFSAWTRGSVVPRPFAGAELVPGAVLFTDRSFGRPGYLQLLSTADQSVVPGSANPSVLHGGPDGAEFGVWSRLRGTVRTRGLRVKLREYLPLGLDPVLVAVN